MNLKHLTFFLAITLIAPTTMSSCSAGKHASSKHTYGVRKQPGFRKCNSKAVRRARYGDIPGMPNLLPNYLFEQGPLPEANLVMSPEMFDRHM
jgi:hypothetical protein